MLSEPLILPTGYGIEHAQCVPPSEFSEPSFITESYQTLHPISSEELLSLKYENDYPSVILRDPVQTDSLQTDYFTIKQEVVTPDNMCMGRASRGTLGHLLWFAWVIAVSAYMNMSGAEIGFKVIREDRLLCGCRNLTFLGDRQKKPHKSFTSTPQELLSKAPKGFTLDDPKSLPLPPLNLMAICLN